ncbi:MAG: D-xylose ABC transporter ATP-binding protein [Pseudonocardiales bacterium]|nr:MAG: D-xylose ABC transporter ATP-binding protein [Pseudonocardiales bacterium]
MEPATDCPLLAVHGIHKSYGGARALRGVDLSLHAGQILGLAGENGSGKSTLLKIISGQVEPDAGRLQLDGAPVRFSDPAQAVSAGIATVTQETTLVPALSVAENILLGHVKPRRRGRVDWRATMLLAHGVLERLGVDLDVRRPVGSLSPDLQQMVEIARAISGQVRILILDEPTSLLPEEESAALLQAMRALRQSGAAIIFVSHRLEEVLEVVDHLTVLRDGLVVAAGARGEFDQRQLIHAMVGHELEELSPSPPGVPRSESALRIQSLSVPGSIHDVSLTVGRGEIVGLAGLVGSGRSELLDAIFGARQGGCGDVEVAGRHYTRRSPVRAARHGLAYVPSERKLRGLVLSMSVRANLLMARHAGRHPLGRVNKIRERALGTTAEREFLIKCSSIEAPVSQLSGGNQQKVVIAKCLLTTPVLLLLDEPTRGVDVGAKADIYRLLQQVTTDGTGILVSSSETSELLLLCDRIVVMYRGRVAAQIDRADASEALITSYCVGGH